MIMEGSTLTLEKCIDIAHTYELMSQSQAQAISNQTPQAVDAISRGKGRGRQRYRADQGRLQTGRRSGRTDRKQQKQEQKCQYCGNNKHSDRRMCPAKGKQCHKCSKYDHFSKVCRSVKSVHEVNSGHVSYSDNYPDYSSDSDDDAQSLYVHTVNTFLSA